ncbi:aminocarboxymuconate-semialdehyde decarboxylase [Pseudonocardia sediminis]|uniref:Aminocarboxymuconate-semialdehyde decarboxylase n=1 Tax=Pseudonocardia sediminis TaxID=1397368 RepID=A0A4V2FQR3_PSEST|nr:amidohydrolase family protein [Pseudonocardia sediminis]RZT85770.1 aminocarboxymuconate-semialdehyde decarboxylase [Pseudonocardia sediminis]
MLVDVHTHAIAPDLAVPPSAEGHAWPWVLREGDDVATIHVGERRYRTVDSRCWSAGARLRDMDAEGIAVQVISPTPVTLDHTAPPVGAAEQARAQNEFFAALVAEAPDRFRALGAVPLQDPVAAVAELRRCVLDLGFDGVEVGARVGSLELADPRFAPFFDAADELGAVVFVHPVDEMLDPRLVRAGLAFGAGMPTETAIAAAALLTAGTLVDRPNVRVCLAHGGGALPSILPRVAHGQTLAGGTPTALERARGLWVDSLTYDLAGLDLAAARVGDDHVVLGTDYPFAAREQPAGAVLAPPCPPERRRAVGVDNPRALLTSARRPATERR